MTKIGMEITMQGADSDQAVGELSAPNPGEYPRGDSDHNLDDDRHHSQLDRRREPNGQFVGHRVAVERLAQVTLKHVAHVEEVLDHQRLVEVVLLPEAGHVARRAGSFAATP